MCIIDADAPKQRVPEADTSTVFQPGTKIQICTRKLVLKKAECRFYDIGTMRAISDLTIHSGKTIEVLIPITRGHPRLRLIQCEGGNGMQRSWVTIESLSKAIGAQKIKVFHGTLS